jgi:hypothetical protein
VARVDSRDGCVVGSAAGMRASHPGTLLARSKSQPQDASNLLLTRSEDLFGGRDGIGTRLIELLDFPEGQVDCKVQRDRRT